MLANIALETKVSERFMYFMFGHLWDKATMCSFFTRSRAKFTAVTVGDINVQIMTTDSSDSLAPHKMISVSLVHLLISMDMLLDLRGLYISPSEVVDSCGVVFHRGQVDCFQLVSSIQLIEDGGNQRIF